MPNPEPPADDPRTTLERRARIHAALADTHRLAIVDSLVMSDRSPSYLAELLGIRSNLLAHHLLTLERAGVIEVTRSAGDRRRRYVRLRLQVIAELGLAIPTVTPHSVLFVCTANSARSPLAVALWRERSTVPADSAGTHPGAEVHPMAVEAAARHGLALEGMTPRALNPHVDMPDLLVTVCDEANEAMTAPGSPLRLHWSIPDPAATADERAFDAAIVEIRSRIDALQQYVRPAAAA